MSSAPTSWKDRTVSISGETRQPRLWLTKDGKVAGSGQDLADIRDYPTRNVIIPGHLHAAGGGRSVPDAPVARATGESADKLNRYLERTGYALTPKGDDGERRGIVDYRSVTLKKAGQLLPSGRRFGTNDREVRVPIYGPAGGSAAAAVEPGKPDSGPKRFKPSADMIEARERAQDFEQRGGGTREPLTFREDFLDNLNAISRYGADQVDDYERRFLPQMAATARLGSLEIGEGSRYAISQLPDNLKLPQVKDIYGDTASYVDEKGKRQVGINPNSIFGTMLQQYQGLS